LAIATHELKHQTEEEEKEIFRKNVPRNSFCYPAQNKKGEMLFARGDERKKTGGRNDLLKTGGTKERILHARPPSIAEWFDP